uniref:non-specific serine/threonine protein kinase n=1 Tax=Leersia perrieri TaxID=77586 RepID=A0A0D9WEG1_9ORYZ
MGKGFDYLRVFKLNVVGEFPSELQNFTYMEDMNLAFNPLTGELPKEIGNLTNLRSLGISFNNFTGKLPEELGNLVKLEQLYIDSSGFSGPFPLTFSKLQNLQILRAQDNDFTGKIPDNFGSMSSLRDMAFQGNSFEGPIPASLSNLTKLTNLILRNCRISGNIGLVDFSRFTALTYLDLSFNNITGQVPPSILNLRSLEFLFLGNNTITGGLPDQISSSLKTLDLSYNQLTGRFPSWVTKNNLQLNLVANNFVLVGTNSSTLPSGLGCLQQDTPCFRGSPEYYSFAVDCGSNSSTSSSDNTIYEADPMNLGTASYYVTGQTRWAVSSVGNFFQGTNGMDRIYTSQNFQNTVNSKLFETARMSASSLRYYGLGLENGNYNVLLQFAEFSYTETPTWQSLGRRVFDIYVQGALKEKNFDIRKTAGGKSFTAVNRSYAATVSKNFLEIHLFWAGKGTCCVPTQGHYGPTISALSITPNFTPTVRNGVPKKRSKAGAIVGVVIGASVLGIAALFGIFLFVKKRRTMEQQREVKPFEALVALCLKYASNFRNVAMAGKSPLLVYEYLENGSLDRALFGNSSLNWPTRFEIILGIARGLTYLHEESSVRIVHRDIKASNVLLDTDLTPKISDFGLAKLYDEKKTHISTAIAGTLGYLAPEYAMRGRLTEKADVFAFGVVALETVAGRPNTDNSLEESKVYLFGWAWSLYENEQALGIVDPSMNEFSKDEALRVIRVALLCTQGSPNQRPPMSKVVAMLTGDVEVADVITKPSYITAWLHRDGDSSYFTNSYAGSYTPDFSREKESDSHPVMIDQQS